MVSLYLDYTLLNPFTSTIKRYAKICVGRNATAEVFVLQSEFWALNLHSSRIEAIHCEWRSSVVLGVRHVGSPFTWE